MSAAFIVTVQPPLPLQAPPQPLKAQPLAGVGVKVTCDPPVKAWLQVDGQLMPAGLLATVPLPVTLTVKLALPPPAECPVGHQVVDVHGADAGGEVPAGAAP